MKEIFLISEFINAVKRKSPWESNSVMVVSAVIIVFMFASTYFAINQPAGITAMAVGEYEESQKSMPPTPICTDSDNGENFNTPGYVIDSSGTKTLDTCQNDKLLIERICKDGAAVGAVKICPCKTTDGMAACV